MKITNRKRQIVLSLLIALIVPLVYILLYQYNNKYKYPGPQPENGLLIMTPEELEENPLLFLVEGWEFYAKQYLNPQDFITAPPTPDAYIQIRDRAGPSLRAGHREDAGAGTYRLRIETGIKTPKRYILEIPEIFSVYCIWINGEHMVEYGTGRHAVESPEISSNYVSFIAQGEIEIVVAVANDAYAVCGIFSPPAFGTVNAVTQYMTINTTATASFFFLALVVGFLFVMSTVWTANKIISISIGALCFSLAWVSSYPMAHFMNLQNMDFWYILNTFFFHVMLLSILYLHFLVCKIKAQLFQPVFIAGCVLCILFTITTIAPAGLLKTLQDLLFPFEKIYKLFIVFYLITVSAVSHLKNNVVKAHDILFAIYTFAVALAVDTFVPNFQPVYMDWAIRAGGISVVIVFVAMMNRETLVVYKNQQKVMIENSLLEESARMGNIQLTLQQQQYKLLASHIEQTRASRHDLRHHLSVIKSFADKQDTANLISYLDQLLPQEASDSYLSLCENSIVNAVASHYIDMAIQKGIKVTARIDLPEGIAISGLDLCVIFGNCLENSLEACERITEPQGEKFIDVKARIRGNLLSIKITNSFDGVIHEDGLHYLSRKREADPVTGMQRGIGLSSVEFIAKKYNGATEFVQEGKIFYATVLLLIKPENLQ